MASSVFLSPFPRVSALDAPCRARQIGAMSFERLIAPSLADFEAMAEAARDALPPVFLRQLGPLVVRVADFASDEMLDELGIEDAYELTGLYEGVALPHQSASDIPNLPAAVWLFRRPILDEWADRGEVELGWLIRHVLVHEVAHHFGFTDDEIAAIDDWRL